MRSLLPLLPKPSRYAGIEDNACRKNPEDVRLRVALAFPDMYEVGMSYLGQKILYSLLNEQPAWRAERVFTPCREAGAGRLFIYRHGGAGRSSEQTVTQPLSDVGFAVGCRSTIRSMRARV